MTRLTRRKKHLAAHAHIQTQTYTMWMRTVWCVASTALYQINDVSKLYKHLVDTQEHVKSKAHQLGTERESTPLASRISNSAVQCQHSHTKSGEVSPEVKQRALCHSDLQRIRITKIVPSQSATTLVERLQVRTSQDKDEHLHGRWWHMLTDHTPQRHIENLC